MITQVDNYNKLASVIVSWVKPRAMALVSKHGFITSANEYLRNSKQLHVFVNMFGLDLRNYSVVDELGFLIDPFLNRFGATYVTDSLKKLASNEEIIPMAKEIVDSALQEAQKRDSKRINIFGIMFDIDDLQSLREAINTIQ